MSAYRRTMSYAVAGFTLIEVLIGVLILALGLLGLGAVIPVIVRQQRQASDQSLGAECARAAEVMLTTRPDMNPSSTGNVGWDVWLNRQTWSGPVTPNPTGSAYLWERWWPNGATPDMDRTTGNAHLVDTTVTPAVYVTFPVTERLWPNESVQSSELVPLGTDPHRPQFVWDFIGRRLPSAAGTPSEPEPKKLQVAVFVRRIDMNIRVPRGIVTGTNPPQSFSLIDVLRHADFLPNGRLDWAVPVCAYASGGQVYRPTNTGVLPGNTLSYSEPIGVAGTSFVAATFDPTVRRDEIVFSTLTSTDNRWDLISQPGQKLLDNLGNVYTVRGIPEDAATSGVFSVLVDPPVPAWVPDPSVATDLASTFRQVVFTPQIPAAIHVFNITRTGK